MVAMQQIWQCHECDLLINIGARFDDRLTGNLKHFAPNATVAHIDIDPAEIGKNVPTDNSNCGRCKRSLKTISRSRWETACSYRNGLIKLQNWNKEYPYLL